MLPAVSIPVKLPMATHRKESMKGRGDTEGQVRGRVGYCERGVCAVVHVDFSLYHYRGRYTDIQLLGQEEIIIVETTQEKKKKR